MKGHIHQLISNEAKHKRFIEAFNISRKNGTVKEVKEFCLLIDYAPSSIWLVLSGKRMVPDVLIYKFCEFFQYNPAYFFGRSESLTTWSQSVSKDIKSALMELLSKLEDNSPTDKPADKDIKNQNKNASE